jgi:hypothetical protein
VKTRFFATYPPGESRAAFLSDFVALRDLDARQLGKFFQILPHVTRAEEHDREEAIDRAASEMNLDIIQLVKLVDWSEYLIRALHDRKHEADQPDQWAADIVSLLTEEGDRDTTTDPEKVYKIALEIASQIWRIAGNAKFE